MKEGREKERSENKNWIKVYLTNIYYVSLLLIKGIDCSENKSTYRNKINSVLFLPCFEHKTQSQVTFLSPQLLVLQTAMVWWVLHAELLSVTRGPSRGHLCVRCTGPRRGSGTWTGPWPATRGRTSRSTPSPARATATTTAGGSTQTLDKGLTRLC